MLSNLEVAVFVEVSAGEPDHIGHGGHITVGVWEEEEVHTAAGCHTLLAQLAIEWSLRGQEALENNTYTSVWIRTERQQTVLDGDANLWSRDDCSVSNHELFRSLKRGLTKDFKT